MYLETLEIGKDKNVSTGSIEAIELVPFQLPVSISSWKEHRPGRTYELHAQKECNTLQIHTSRFSTKIKQEEVYRPVIVVMQKEIRQGRSSHNPYILPVSPVPSASPSRLSGETDGAVSRRAESINFTSPELGISSTSTSKRGCSFLPSSPSLQHTYLFLGADM
jgi:hypothetical protein